MVIRGEGQSSASKLLDIMQSKTSSGSERTACREGICSESSEPLVGRLGASTHSEGIAYKPPCGEMRCACEWGGWGRLSDDGPGQNNPDRSEGPWGSGVVPLHGGALSSPRPDTVRDYRSDHEVHEGRKQTGRRSAHVGSRLKLSDAPGRPRLICQPFSRTGENPPYGILGGIEETSASFEARSAPRSYPTISSFLAGHLSWCTT